MIFRDFQRAWFESHPHERVIKVAVSRNNWGAILSIMAGLIAVNILSAAHTIPVIATTVSTDVIQVKIAVGVSAFFAVEFMMVIMMILNISHWLRYVVIGLALIVAIVANVVSTLQAVESGPYAAGGWVVGIVLGLFAPLANLAAGEMLRSIIKQAADRVTLANTNYEQAVKDLDTKIRGQYTTYLKRVGITDPTQIMELMGNENNRVSFNVEPTSSVVGNSSDSVELENRSSGISSNTLGNVYSNQPDNNSLGSKSSAATELAERIRSDGAENLSYSDLQKKYGKSPNTIRKAKQLLG